MSRAAPKIPLRVPSAPRNVVALKETGVSTPFLEASTSSKFVSLSRSMTRLTAASARVGSRK
ncbi:MAG: hypothetical protein L3K08_03185 [Thermoplasmata archaeon]|nr:hypothetical protein [Thermoplasmata archaeon]